jgi:hypothetical protein
MRGKPTDALPERIKRMIARINEVFDQLDALLAQDEGQDDGEPWVKDADAWRTG